MNKDILNQNKGDSTQQSTQNEGKSKSHKKGKGKDKRKKIHHYYDEFIKNLMFNIIKDPKFKSKICTKFEKGKC